MLRIGVRTGLLAGFAFAVLKVVQSRRGNGGGEFAHVGPKSWPAMPDPVTVEPAAPLIASRAAPVNKAAPVATTSPAEASSSLAPRKAPAAPKRSAVRKAPGVRRGSGAPTARTTRSSASPESPATATPGGAWVEATGGVCPPSHPVKAKLSSRLFHLPGMAFYNRTAPDRCYRDEPAAVEDGFTRSKR